MKRLENRIWYGPADLADNTIWDTSKLMWVVGDLYTNRKAQEILRLVSNPLGEQLINDELFVARSISRRDT